jgi:succinate dehydrogenase/fumarate reductase flavoprotein subunit
MENEVIQTGGFTFRYYAVNTLIVGSGAASLNAAVSLHSMGQKDIMIATSKWGGGTSNNAGSDKQTYYKLSMSGSEPDSPVLLARDLFNGRCMHGDIALCEALGSIRSFIRLTELGVPFPHDRYGAWAGYKTDNDPRARATSAGPYTSRMMVTALSEEVRKRRIRVLDHHEIIELVTDRNKSRVIGAVAIDRSAKDPFKAFVLFNAVNIILGTGGPGEMYHDSVYPKSQTGSAGFAFRAGAPGQNLTESQFGIASLKFRWNLSGSYQQVIPAYISTDKKGNDRREFLYDSFNDYKSLTRAIFLKGYQWPFDPAKAALKGSSLIDLLVFREMKEKGRRVFLDYRINVSHDGHELFIPDHLDDDVRKYLSRSDALQALPVERLMSMNRPAYELYRDHGIDLAKEPVEIGVCVQHNNGGLKGNIWWESDLKHLFPVGEVNGSHGVHRPGGSALNSGQVGSMRAAEYISRRYNDSPVETDRFINDSADAVSAVTDLAALWLECGRSSHNRKILAGIQERMSSVAGILRDHHNVSIAFHESTLLVKQVRSLLGAKSVKELAECFRISDMCLTQMIYLASLKYYIENGGRSRGSFIIDGVDGLCDYDRDIEMNIVEAVYKTGNVSFSISEVRPIPDGELWFEKVWKEYLQDKYCDS